METHLVERILSDQISARQALDSILLKMGQFVSKMVLGEWNKIFGRPKSAREIVFDFGKDEDGDVFLELKIREGGDIYEVQDRSLGFRWFLSFLLATTYATRGLTSPALLLLDEPASNLHPAAQARLLDRLNNMKNCRVIYTTHSHHMVNPDWLNSTYIVRNKALLDSEAIEDFDPKSTEVEVFRYKTFVGSYPEQVSYFQPVLDILEYTPSKLGLDAPSVIVEGRSDYCALRIGFSGRDKDFNLIPGTGAGASSSLIQLLIGWGIPFLVLLDSDSEGLKQKKLYVERFGKEIDGRVITWSDLNASWVGMGLEEVIGKETVCEIIHASLGIDVKTDKKRLLRSLETNLLVDAPPHRRLLEIVADAAPAIREMLTLNK